MPKIGKVDLVNINKQIDTIDDLRKQVATLKERLAFVGNQITIADPSHAPQTTNNLSFTWTGASLTLSWAKGFLKDKNWSAQSTTTPSKSSAPGAQHFWLVPAGSLPLSASTFYWLAWDAVHQVMRASTDASILHSNYNLVVVCQVFTGTGGQSGTAGGGGGNGGVDFSGTRYKNF